MSTTQELLATGRWVIARYAGICTSCGKRYPKGIAVQSGGHWGSGRWIAQCCAQLDGEPT